VQARQLLAREIGWARGLEQVEADAWIEEQATPANCRLASAGLLVPDPSPHASGPSAPNP